MDINSPFISSHSQKALENIFTMQAAFRSSSYGSFSQTSTRFSVHPTRSLRKNSSLYLPLSLLQFLFVSPKVCDMNVDTAVSLYIKATKS